MILSEDKRIQAALREFLINFRGYPEGFIVLDEPFSVTIGGRKRNFKADLSVRYGERLILVAKCSPGSVVTRERHIVSIARLMDKDCIVPLAIVTNGEEVSVLDGETGKIISEGWDGVPHWKDIPTILAGREKLTLTSEQRRKESHILDTYEFISCSCNADNNE